MGNTLAVASAAAARLLPEVVPDAPAAVLLVDVATGGVTYASEVAGQLAPGVALPYDVDTWSRAAGLHHADGGEVAGSARSLRTLAAGGTPKGQVLTARLSSDISEGRELLWATALPLTDAPGLAELALLVFLPARDTEAVATARSATDSAVEIRDRAVLATGLSFTVATAGGDHELVWVNPAFCATTGYGYEESVGKNCRFLQGPDTDPQAHVEIRRALTTGEPIVTTLLNYRKDGTAFWNQLAVNPVRDASGAITHFVGIQTDVTERQRIEVERQKALESARAAQRAAEQAQAAAERATERAVENRRRLSLLAEATSLLAGTLDVDETFDRLIRLALPLLADWIVVDIQAEEGLERQVIVRDSRGRTDLAEQLQTMVIDQLGPSSLSKQVLATGRPVLRASWSQEDIERSYTTEEMRRVVLELGLSAVMSVPLRARRKLLGVMTFVAAEEGRGFTDDDLADAADLARRAAVSLDNARLYTLEHRNAETLQRSLLPDLPTVPGVEVAARYLAGATSAEVGGDFYELLDLPDGAVGFAIGDVVGHDIAAAAAMGHLRGLLRACAWDTAADDGGAPGKVMTRVDRLVQGLHVAPLATVVYARLERPAEEGGDWRLRWSNAGHPPPALLLPDGTVELLDDEPGLLLGVDDLPRETHVRQVPPGSTLFVYTDGLVERRGADIDSGLAWLRGHLAALGPVPPETLVARTVTGLTGVDDDVAVLAVRIS